MYPDHFYNKLTKKYIATFGSIFNNISIVRYNQDGTENNRDRCPITFAPKDKHIQKLKSDLKLDDGRKPQVKLPQISFELDQIEYDSARKYSSTKKIKWQTEEGTQFLYQPVPYKLSFSLNVYTKGLDEMYQVLEQIIPFFQTDFTVTINPIEGSDIEIDIPVNLISIIPSDSYEGSFDDRRVIIWNFSFIASVDYFGPVRKGKLIYKTRININDKDTSETFSQVEVTPYQDGLPPDEIDLEEFWSTITAVFYGDEIQP